MSAAVTDGWLKGATIRTARKDHRCADASRSERLGLTKCLRTIRKGEHYAEGDCNPYSAGGYGHERWCMACVDECEAVVKARGSTDALGGEG